MTTKEQIEKIIQGSPDSYFVIWMKNAEETKEIFDILNELGYECTIPLQPFKVMWEQMCKESENVFGVKVKCYAKDCSFNSSLSHWYSYTKDVVAFDSNHELQFVDEMPEYTDELTKPDPVEEDFKRTIESVDIDKETKNLMIVARQTTEAVEKVKKLNFELACKYFCECCADKEVCDRNGYFPCKRYLKFKSAID